MQRYFLELAYIGSGYKGFQIQPVDVTVQSQVENALGTLLRQKFNLTGSSRTDAGVHAHQNFFHFDTDIQLQPKQLYNLNAILPPDIVVKGIYKVSAQAHARFDAESRLYRYIIYRKKDAFFYQRGWYYPFSIDMPVLHSVAAIIKASRDFTSFSKRNTQAKTFNCKVEESVWTTEGNTLVYTVSANRFLRGMVRALVATMLKAGRHTITIDQFQDIVDSKDCSRADFSAPAHGLYLTQVSYPPSIFSEPVAIL
ncbi:tRNA pseudouridine(38-40) synthase TruA [Panacibacter sp. DH6]|uniref:tRNA pseudouridine synthase A n=2 Tax=Panacibacter microcysteis TaxID=2793269 RepID=A0A931E026_9BACT|nr:tRNA pseudouridine(38-40) synthase TruA [Panacibacter microcysteis]